MTTPPGTVSVVIPTKDRCALTLEAIASAVAAGGVDEVIVVDAGSTDGTQARVAALTAPVRLVQGSHRNAAAARNAGIREARGAYIGFLDSDDLMEPAKVASLRRVLDADPGVGLVHGRTVVVDGGGRPDAAATELHERQRRRAEAVGTGFAGLAEYCSLYTSATLMRRAALEDVGGYDEALDVYEDWDLYLRLSLRWQLVYADEVAARYRLWPGNVAWDRTARGTVAVARKQLAALPPLASGERRRAAYALQRRIAEASNVLVEPRATRSAATAALRCDPRRALGDSLLGGLVLRSFVPRSLRVRRRPG